MQAVQTGCERLAYDWVEDWVKIPDTESSRASGRTHGVVVTEAGTVLIFHQANPAVLHFCPGGGLLHSWGERFAGRAG